MRYVQTSTAATALWPVRVFQTALAGFFGRTVGGLWRAGTRDEIFALPCMGEERSNRSELADRYRARAAETRARARMLTFHYARMNCWFAETLEELARQAEQARGNPDA